VPTIASEATPLAVIADSLATIVRNAQLPRVHERIAAHAGLRLDRSAFAVLRRIGEHRRIRLSDLAQHLGVDTSTISRQIRALEKDDLVVRRMDKSDGRVSLLALSARGERALTKLRRARLEFVSEVLAGWSGPDQATLAPLLERLADDFAQYAQR
jgi:DNA-binding MarR family transcriptional regulator